MSARANRSAVLDKVKIDKNLGLEATELTKGAQRFNDWHWGINPGRVMDMDDADYPKMLIECGRLIRMHVRAPEPAHTNSTHPRRKRDTMIELSRSTSNTSHLCFDPDHPEERLYLLLDSRASDAIGKRFWNENNAKPMDLNHLATIAGGKHGKRQDYPRIEVKPIGVLTAIVYYTHKKGDENPGNPRSYYIHQVGELSHHYPILCCDDRGRLWLAGGNYTSPNPGITD